MAYKLMAHMIPWYPNRSASLEAAKGILEGGARYLEVQFPYSDPTADGPVIEAACTKALAGGFTVDQGFTFVRELYDWIDGFPKGSPRLSPADNQVPTIFIMSYASLVYTRGVEQFVMDAVRAGAKGLIVPDLPPDSDEGLYEACARNGIHAIPVVVPFTSPERLNMILAAKPEYIYVALRAGTTGTDTVLSPEVLGMLSDLGSRGVKVMGGFGLSRPEQLHTLMPHLHAAIVGSALVRVIDSCKEATQIREKIRAKVAELTGIN